MKRWHSIALLLLLVSAACLPAARGEDEDVDLEDDEDELDEAERAFLVVRRTLSEDRPLEGKPVTVTIELYNAGAVPALNVDAKDAQWPEDNFVTEGVLTATFDSIPVGASVRHSYTVTPKAAGTHRQFPAMVSYMSEEGGKSQTTTSAWLEFQAFTVVEAVQMRALQLGGTLSAGYLNTLQDWLRAFASVGAVAALYAIYKSYGSLADSSRERKRAKALAALEAMEKKK